MKTLSELEKSPYADFKRAHALAAKSVSDGEGVPKEPPLPGVIDLDTPVDEESSSTSPYFNTGEPGLGRNTDIIGAKGTNYVSCHILGRLF